MEDGEYILLGDQPGMEVKVVRHDDGAHSSDRLEDRRINRERQTWTNSKVALASLTTFAMVRRGKRKPAPVHMRLPGKVL